tara:strand:+ start:496 stop:771 length:276 start_codon:yes stop_codon:yes gene_type:complete
MNQTISGSDNLLRNVDVGHMLELREKLAVSTAERDEARATARCLGRELIELQDAIRKASNDYNKLAWGSDGSLDGPDRIIESLEDLLPENQ